LLVSGAIVLFGVFAYYTISRSATVTHGFTMYYVYARVLLEEDDFSRVFDYAWFNGKVREYGIQGIQDMPNNIPTNALVLAPVAMFSPTGAKLTLGIASLASLVASLLILLHVNRISLKESLAPLIATLFFLWRPLYENAYLGQIYSVLLFLFCLCLLGISRSRLLLSSIPIALALLAKGYGIVPAAWLAVRHKWRQLLILVATISLIVALTIPWLGIQSWEIFSSQVLSTLGTLPTDAHVAFQTINGFLFHLFTYDPVWLPFPIFVAPKELLRFGSYVLNLALVLFVLNIARRHRGKFDVLSFAAALAAGVVTAPLAEEYHFVLFLPLVIGVTVLIMRRIQNGNRPGWLDGVCLASIIVLGVPLGYKNLQFAQFPLILLAYPKLWSGIALLCCLSPLLDRSRKEEAEPGLKASTPAT